MPPRTPLRLAPAQAPAIRLEILGTVLLAPIGAALLDRHSLGALPALLHAAVQDHVDDLLAEDMREVCVPRRFRARNPEEHPGHKLPPRAKRPPSRPWTGAAVSADRAGARLYR